MTTLLDDGLVESCSEEPNSEVELDLNVIDLDSIDATIEDPGYILDEASDTFNQTEEYTSSYKKRSFALPVAFFDISRNISLLKKCRPISIKIVDCDIYPWYYKKLRPKIQSINEAPEKDQDSVPHQPSHDSPNLITSISCDTDVEEPLCISPPTSLPILNHLSEQKSAVLKLTKEIESQVFVDESRKYNKENPITKNHKDLLQLNENSAESGVNISTQSKDLLTYKAIAQTIVRNVDINKSNSDSCNLIACVQSPDTIMFNKNKLEMEKSPEKTVTSPILPYSVKPKKTTKKKEFKLNTPPRNNNVFEKCSHFNRQCAKFMSSVNTVIPHYHCKVRPPANNNNNFYCTTTFADQMHFGSPAIENPSFHWQSDIVSDHNFQGRVVRPPNGNFGEMSYYLDMNGKMYNSPVINTSQVINQHPIENMNPNVYTPISNCQFYYPVSCGYGHSMYAASQYVSQTNRNNRGSPRYVKRGNTNQIIEENLNGFNELSAPSQKIYDCVPKSTSLPDGYVNYTKTQIPLQKTNSNNMANVIQNNPLLSQLLENTLSDINQQALKQRDGVGPRPVIGRVSHPSKGLNCRFPPVRPPPPPYPYCEHYLPSVQFSQDQSFQYSNTGNNFINFSKSEHMLNYNKDSNLIQSKMNLNKVVKSFSNTVNTRIPTDATRKKPNVKVSAQPNIDVNHGSSRPTVIIGPTSDQKACNDVTTKTNDQININDAVKLTAELVPDKKTTKKRSVDAIIKEIVKNSNSLKSKVETNNRVINQKSPTSDTYESDFLSKNDKTFNSFNTSAKALNATNIIDSKVNGYSPPILPIPTFKKSLEMISVLQQSPNPKLKENNILEPETHKVDYNYILSKPKSQDQEYASGIKKRKLKNDGDFKSSSKKISLQEYKIRKSENTMV